MYKVIFTVNLILFSSFGFCQTSPAELLAQKIAQKMSDSLSLSQPVMLRIYDVNIQLHSQKMNARKVYSGNDLLAKEIQAIENTRDSIYRSILTEGEYKLYRQKKRYLVNNND